MAPALILTEEAAAQAGYSGAGPFTFAGVFPGEWTLGEPLRISELGFDSDDDARDALAEAGVPLEEIEVGPGEGFAKRFNHAAGEMQVEAAAAEVELDTGEPDFDRIRTHAQANEAADRLEISFAEGATVAEKVEALKAVAAGGAIDTTGETPQILTEGNEAPEPDADEEEGGS